MAPAAGVFAPASIPRGTPLARSREKAAALPTSSKYQPYAKRRATRPVPACGPRVLIVLLSGSPSALRGIPAVPGRVTVAAAPLSWMYQRWCAQARAPLLVLTCVPTEQIVLLSGSRSALLCLARSQVTVAAAPLS